MVGDLYLSISDAWAQAEVQDRTVDAQAEIGWALDPAHQGRGLALEAVRRLVDLLLRGPGPAPGLRHLLRRQRRVLAADGEARDAPRGAHRARTRCTASAAGSTGTPTPCLADEWSARRRRQSARASGHRAALYTAWMTEPKYGPQRTFLHPGVAEARHRVQRAAGDPAAAGRAAGHVAGQALVLAAAVGVLDDRAGARPQRLAVERAWRPGSRRPCRLMLTRPG